MPLRPRQTRQKLLLGLHVRYRCAEYRIDVPAHGETVKLAAAASLTLLRGGFDDVSAISVEPVSLLTPTNTITTGGIWGLLFILVIPAALLIYGFVRWMHRRKL